MGYKGKEPYITVGANSRWYFGNPSESALSLVEAVEALCQLPRFAGHARLVGGNIYSVAQHSIKVAWITGTLEGLMHDAHECVIGDYPTPLKQFYRATTDAIDAIDKETAKRFAELFGTSYPLPPEVKRADSIMCLIEARFLLPNRGKDIWLGPRHKEIEAEVDDLVRARPELCPHLWTIEHTKAKFLEEFEMLSMRRSDETNITD